MAAKLPPYVWEDLQHCFPARIGGDSIETPAHYYDYNYFNSLITYSQRDVHFHHIASSKEFEPQRVHIYNGCIDYTSDVACVHGHADYLREVPIIAKKSKINIVITHRNWESAIPQMSWDIMASGGFLISNIQKDYFEIFKDTVPVMYEDKFDLRKKGIYYFENETERKSIARELSEEVMENHSYEKRINLILEKCM
jgi:hypothetical protein